jgi:hypothetical protein
MQLKPSYATVAYGDLSINAYTDEGEQQKKLFLRDGRTFFLAVAKSIKVAGFESLGVHSGPAGVAVSGDVWFKAWNEVRQQGLSLHLSESYVSHDRVDRLALVANELSQRVTRGKGRQTHADFKCGPNVWLSANLNSDDLARQLLKMLRVERHTPSKKCQQGQLALFDEVVAAMSYPELDIWLCEGCEDMDGGLADHIVQIAIQGELSSVRPQMERLLAGLAGWGSYVTSAGLEVTLNVHLKTLSGLWARIQAQNNWLGANGQMPNVSLRYGRSHEDLREVYLGLNLWCLHEPLVQHKVVAT